MNGNWFQNRWQRLPEAVIRRAQAEQLRSYLREVVLPFSQHYRELFRQHGLRFADVAERLDSHPPAKLVPPRLRQPR